MSHHTALEFHGRAYSVWQRFIYSAERPAETLTFRDQVFRGTKFPQALVRSGAEYHCVLTMERFGMPLRVASLERTLVDALDRPDLAGGWEEVWRSLEAVEFFDLDEVVEYAVLLGNATTTAKVGFFLDRNREPLMVEERPSQGAAGLVVQGSPITWIGVRRSGGKDGCRMEPHGACRRCSRSSWADVA